MESINSATSQKGDEKMELVLRCDINVSKQPIKKETTKLNLSWVNPRVDDLDYPFLDSFSGEWNVEVLRLRKKMKFQDIVHSIKKDGWQPATVYHLLALLGSQNGRNLSGSLMAPGSLCIDDFEYPGCVVLSIDGDEKNSVLVTGEDPRLVTITSSESRKYPVSQSLAKQPDCPSISSEIPGQFFYIINTCLI